MANPTNVVTRKTPSPSTVISLANMVGMPPERVLEQLKEAGVEGVNTINDIVTPSQKLALLKYLQQRHGSEKTTETISVTQPAKKITLKPQQPQRRKGIEEIQVSRTGSGRAKMVTVEVRKKHTYVKPSAKTLLDEEKKEDVSTVPTDLPATDMEAAKSEAHTETSMLPENERALSAESMEISTMPPKSAAMVSEKEKAGASKSKREIPEGRKPKERDETTDKKGQKHRPSEKSSDEKYRHRRLCSFTVHPRQEGLSGLHRGPAQDPQLGPGRRNPLRH